MGTFEDKWKSHPLLISSEGSQPEPVDKYTAAIELSNACRQFYVSRLQAADRVKERLGLCVSDATKEHDTTRGPGWYGLVQPGNSQHPTLDKAMTILKKEMSSLIDQDLALMKQLLTLNEQIEELKWQRKFQYSRGSLNSSCCFDDGSGCTLSDVDSETLGSDRELHPSKYPSPSSLSLYKECLLHRHRLSHVDRCHHASGHTVPADSTSDLGSYGDIMIPTDSISQVPPATAVKSSTDDEAAASFKKTHSSGEQSSFDSGIHDTDCAEFRERSPDIIML